MSACDGRRQEPLVKRCILGAHACVTSRTDYDDDDRGPSNYLAGVDITFNRSRFEDVPGHHESTEAADNRGRWYPRVPREIHFNTCLDRQVPRFTNLDRGYGAYSIAVHEAGHALGLSNVTDSWRYVVDALTPFVNPFQADIYHASHSSTRGSVMNYDSEVWDTFEPGLLSSSNRRGGYLRAVSGTGTVNGMAMRLPKIAELLMVFACVLVLAGAVSECDAGAVRDEPGWIPDVSGSGPEWSSDGTVMVFDTGHGAGPTGIYVVDAEGTWLHRVPEGPSAPRFFNYDVAPDLSPDGSRVVYSTLCRLIH